MPNDPGFVPRSAHADIVAAALAGLRAHPKTLPSRLFYDEEGCRLFYEITRLPEYYLTRTETALLKKLAADLVPAGFKDAVLVEFGGSDESKARVLLDLPGVFDTYVSIDVAQTALQAMCRRLSDSHPDLTTVPVTADFTQTLDLPVAGRRCLGFFPGSTIGNLDPDAATAFLDSARRSLGRNAWFLLGADLRKSPDVLLPAYNDAAGVTAAFNLNLLVRLNRETGANFDVNGFRHEAVWDDAASRVEMHLIARRDQAAQLAGQTITFREGESIHTENSYKHTKAALTGMANAAGWSVRQVWSDDAGLFGLFLLRHG